MDAPNYWAHAVWGVQWAQIALGVTVDSLSISDAVNNPNRQSEDGKTDWIAVVEIVKTGFDGILGVVNFGLMSHLSQTDEWKADKIKADQAQNTPLSEDQKLFYDWWDAGGNGRKTAGNLFDTIPAIAGIGTIGKLGSNQIALAAKTGICASSHLIEAGIYTARTHDNELY
jgi:hypothetical protein